MSGFCEECPVLQRYWPSVYLISCLLRRQAAAQGVSRLPGSHLAPRPSGSDSSCKNHCQHMALLRVIRGLLYVYCHYHMLSLFAMITPTSSHVTIRLPFIWTSNLHLDWIASICGDLCTAMCNICMCQCWSHCMLFDRAMFRHRLFIDNFLDSLW